MAQVKDRWIEKILSHPLFDEAFKNAIASTPLASMSFIAAGRNLFKEFLPGRIVGVQR